MNRMGLCLDCLSSNSSSNLVNTHIGVLIKKLSSCVPGAAWVCKYDVQKSNSKWSGSMKLCAVADGFNE